MTPRERKIVELFRSGKTDAEIGAEVGLSAKRAQVIRLSLKLKRPPRPHGGMTMDLTELKGEFENKPEDETIVAFTERMSFQTGYHADSIRRVLRDKLHVVAPKEYFDRDSPEALHALSLLKDGMPYEDVAFVTEISVHTLRYNFPGLGVQLEDRWAYVAAKKLEEEVLHVGDSR